MQGQAQTKQNNIAQILAAIEYEQQHLYINAVGRSGTFAEFIKKEAKKALRVYKHSSKWQSIKALISRYDFVDVTTRINIVKQIHEILEELNEFYGNSTVVDLGDDSTNTNKEAIKEESFSDAADQIKLSSSKKVKEEIQIDPNLDVSELDIQYIKGVGPALANKLRALEINSCEDLLHYLPRKHISYQDKVLISDLEMDQDVTILGEIFKISAFKSPKSGLVIMTIIIKDSTGKVKVNKFFKGNSTHFYLKQFNKQYPTGAQVLCAGTVKADKYSKQFQISNPVLEVVSADFTEGEDNVHTGRIVPIYPLTEGLSLMQLRKVMHHAVTVYKDNLKEFIPEEVVNRYDLLSYSEALEQIHFPTSLELQAKANQRLIFNEFFLMQLRFAQRRNQVKNQNQGIEFNCFENGLLDKFLESLPFNLTYAQQRVFYSEILPDLVSPSSMHRLLQGDVGCGKTVVAFMTLLLAIDNGYQGAIMAPTEILSEQHYRSFQTWVNKLSEQGEGFGLKVGLLTGSMRVKEKREVLQGLANGEIKIVIGTHALIQDAVEFQNLGLVIIDEQHRFGVKQRDMLTQKAKGEAKSLERLFMSATPIPRTLALSMHGDLDLSEIDEMPPGRSPVITKYANKKTEAYKLITDEVSKGRQAYIVFPLIDESEALSAKAATVEYERLCQKVFPDFKIGLMHGKLPDDEKESTMEAFRKGEVDILVATTVIEVGVDVPNATVMLIESSERFGLSQLHQLRGRVGRGEHQAYCLLASSSNSTNNQTRIKIMTSTNNGFVVAQEDMKLRGAGDFLGTRQSGIPDFALAGIVEHEEVLHLARNAAKNLIALDPDLESEKVKLLKKKLELSSYAALLTAG